jgi:hypothetical protein
MLFCQWRRRQAIVKGEPSLTKQQQPNKQTKCESEIIAGEQEETSRLPLFRLSFNVQGITSSFLFFFFFNKPNRRGYVMMMK